jgi:RNA polymerase sigma-70 factor (ECF subfamily)
MLPVDSNPPPKPEWFATTHWSVVLAAGQAASPDARTALETLCRTYWLPLYSYVRRRGYDPHDALDLTQGFFALLLERNDFAIADPQRGRFRSFLLASLNHFLANEHPRASAAKRGGGCVIISLDDDSAEQRYGSELLTELSPDKLYEQRWAMAVMLQGLADLQREMENSGKGKHFQELKDFLTREPSPGEYDRVGAILRISAGTVAVAVHRLRQRYRELVRAAVAETVSSPAEIDDEMRYLLNLLHGG